ncbi:acidic mammalian chitinase-like [Mytilus californianus]|uniref:acidic mammalian chitinase-like n=1 Tax=Mytilus californianus TaxID=6549 RepID=UPI002246727A|nr:acidic mammalian chitinase-like [Mytilus californianus]
MYSNTDVPFGDSAIYSLAKDYSDPSNTIEVPDKQYDRNPQHILESTEYKRVCYYTNWSQYRLGTGKFLPSDIDPYLCTHIIYAFGKLHGNMIQKLEYNDYELHAQLNDLKRQNPSLETLLALGGWTTGSVKLKEAFDAESHTSGLVCLLLTAAVAAGKYTADTAYDILTMAQYMDFINIMSYDLHGSWQSTTGHNGPLFPKSNEYGDQKYLNINLYKLNNLRIDWVD